jgi:hypothetical protein
MNESENYPFFTVRTATGSALTFADKEIVFNTNIANRNLIVAFSLHFSVAIATHISLASHLTCITKPHSLRDDGPLRAGLTIARVICECHCTWTVLLKLRPY